MIAVIGATLDWIGNQPYRLQFEMPIMPPSVNHYVKHPAQGVHVKTAEAKAYIRDFALLAPRDFFVQSPAKRFLATLEYWPGPGGRGDVDNYNKLPLDCCAKAGMLRDGKNQECSDAWIKRMTVEIHDEPEDREIGPKMRITIEAL